MSRDNAGTSVPIIASGIDMASLGKDMFSQIASSADVAKSDFVKAFSKLNLANIFAEAFARLPKQPDDELK